MDIFTDRDGDILSVTPRRDFNPIPDPIITITHKEWGQHNISQSVVFVEAEAPKIIIGLIGALNLNKEQINEIFDLLGGIQAAVNSREE